jgi:hypothetical protein
MEIEIGKYVITSDPLCIVLNEKKKVKSGENKGKEYISPVGYYHTVENCMDALIELKIRESQATSLKELVDEVRKISKFIRKQFKEARAGK